jgi:hypothetical protein
MTGGESEPGGFRQSKKNEEKNMTNLAKARGGAAVRPVAVRALRVNDFCTAYGYGRSAAYGLIRQGKLASVLIGGKRLISVDSAEALIAGDSK